MRRTGSRCPVSPRAEQAIRETVARRPIDKNGAQAAKAILKYRRRELEGVKQRCRESCICNRRRDSLGRRINRVHRVGVPAVLHKRQVDEKQRTIGAAGRPCCERPDRRLHAGEAQGGEEAGAEEEGIADHQGSPPAKSLQPRFARPLAMKPLRSIMAQFSTRSSDFYPYGRNVGHATGGRLQSHFPVFSGALSCGACAAGLWSKKP